MKEEMTKHAASILQLKTKHPTTSFVDLIDDYCDRNPYFDMDEFCDYLKNHNKSLREYIKSDLVKFNYVRDDIAVMWSELF